MTNIEAAEDSFKSANRFYLVAWLITAVIFATAYFEFRQYRSELQDANATIKYYRNLETLGAASAERIRSYVYLRDDFETERKSINVIRQQRSQLFSEVRSAKVRLAQSSQLSGADRARINKPLDTIGALLMLNDLHGLQPEFTFLENHPSLTWSEHSPGSYRVSNSIEELSFDDLVRYQWLTTMNMPAWLGALAELRTVLLEDKPTQSVIVRLQDLRKTVLQSRLITERKNLEYLWQSFLSIPSEEISDLEKRRRSNLTLREASKTVSDSIEKREELTRRLSGTADEVEIPGLSVPLQLKDAILISPWILAFCGLAIAIYIVRGVRYASKISGGDEVIGHLPSFFAFFGFWRPLGYPIAGLLLIGPALLFLLLLPFMMPILLVELDASAVFYFVGSALAIIFLAIPLFKFREIEQLIDEEVIVSSAPIPGFPALASPPAKESPNEGIGLASNSLVPQQFIGCWKTELGAPTSYFLKIDGDGRYFISDGKTAFSIENNGNVLKWSGGTWTRSCGKGAEIVGSWVQEGDTFVVDQNLTTMMIIPGAGLPGTIQVHGSQASGEIVYFEQRALILSAIELSGGVFEFSAQSIFGGSSIFRLSVESGRLKFETEQGETLAFRSVSCSTLQ